MNRRTALKFMAGAVAAFVLPGPRRRIDLMAFCAKHNGAKWDMRLPYHLADWCYATDASVCVRVEPHSADRVQNTGPVPPFEGLAWNHDALRGWRPLPDRQPLLASGSDCPNCDGYGHVPSTVMAEECERCWGTGWGVSPSVRCRKCRGTGRLLPPGCEECPVCNGNAIGVFPSVVELAGSHFDVRLYRRVQNLPDAEFVLDNYLSSPTCPLMKFRFDGGCGLLMGIVPATAAARIETARTLVQS
jgi:hypothetical protein